ncbi:MAG: hypothetical protein JWO06_2578 [Bacteroidota bacterium]|nr:hypothetical protein [Bacteroidota bacterium]
MKIIKCISTVIFFNIAIQSNLFPQSSPNDPFYNDLVIAGSCFDALSGATIVSALATNAVQRNANGAANFSPPKIFAPRVGLGLLSIAYGSGIVANTNNFDDSPVGRRAIRVGISDIALGIGDIIIPPLFNLMFSGIESKNSSKQPKAPPVDVSLFVPRAVSGNFALGFSVHKIF